MRPPTSYGRLPVRRERTSTPPTRPSSDNDPAARLAGLRPRELLGREHELATLEQLLETVRSGGSGALFVHGEPGIGKSALLERLIASASGCLTVRAVGVQGEVDLPYAGLHQLCRSLFNGIDTLPPPQRHALEVAFGLTSGDASDRYLVGLAVLSLLSEAATTRPLLCVVDDAQWLDTETTRVLAFVARRLGADTVGLVLASREQIGDFAGLRALHVGGLAVAEARALLDSVVVGRLDEPVRERFLAETHGNPLALLELPHTLTPAEAATGILRGPEAPFRTGSKRASDCAWSRFQTRRDGYSSWSRSSRSAIRSSFTAPPQDSASAWRPSTPRRKKDCSRSESDGRFAIPCFAPRPTDRRHTKNGDWHMARLPRRSSPPTNRTGRLGTARTQPSGRMRASRSSSSDLPVELRRAAASLRQQHCCNDR